MIFVCGGPGAGSTRTGFRNMRFGHFGGQGLGAGEHHVAPGVRCGAGGGKPAVKEDLAGRRSLVGIRLEDSVQKAFCLLGYVLPLRGGEADPALAHGFCHGLSRVSGKREAAAEESVQNDSETPDVGLGAVRFVVDLLRGHVEGGAWDAARRQQQRTE